MDEETLLHTIDECRQQYPKRWFLSEPVDSQAKTMKLKFALDFACSQCSHTISAKTSAIFDALLYKMSAGYRHLLFWKASRRVYKTLVRVNGIDVIFPMEKIAMQLKSSQFNYLPTMEATDYVEACLLSRAALISRLDSLCIKAGDYCFRQLELGHLIPATLLILALVADIWKDIQSQLRALIDSYERVRQAVVSSRLPLSILQYEFLRTLRQNDRSADTLSFLRYRRLLSDALQISSDDVTTSMLSQLVRDDTSFGFQASYVSSNVDIGEQVERDEFEVVGRRAKLEEHRKNDMGYTAVCGANILSKERVPVTSKKTKVKRRKRNHPGKASIGLT